MNEYLFTSERLGFRSWKESDLIPFSKINADRRVMKHFPGTVTKEDSKVFMAKMNYQIEKKGYGYFSVELLKDKKWIGFIGLSYQDFESDFTPCVDIGWRLDTDFWNYGYATEGAKRCLEFAFNTLKINEILSHAPKVNSNSIEVMKKIGMDFITEFMHPKLLETSSLNPCVLFGIKNPRF